MSTVFRVEKTANFTVMSNIHLKDKRLSFKAKGLMSVILSLPPEWDYTVTGLAYIAADGIDSVRAAVRELERCGYINRRQLRDEQGRMSGNEYLVYENPAQNPDVSAERISENTTEKASDSESRDLATVSDKGAFLNSPSTVSPSTDKPSTENPSTATIKKLNKKISNTNQSNHSIAPAREDRIELIDSKYKFEDFSSFSARERDYYRAIISENIGYEDTFANDYGERDQVSEMISIMTDVVCSSAPTIRVNGEPMPKELVKKRFLELSVEEINYVLYAMKHNSSRVGNMRSYLITTLYNSKSTISNYYSNMAYNDIREGRI